MHGLIQIQDDVDMPSDENMFLLGMETFLGRMKFEWQCCAPADPLKLNLREYYSMNDQGTIETAYFKKWKIQ
ncbi:unnamed protein product [Didymodactylos carnosus]|uniref:Uncharacterized protein n=2 Tax=Didymodactylos carnosus TaxID=1234261 RepID=A0A814B334_9BILA|nr:unnamed protein product [Didymodactylos carnosus]CAF3702097.1 unnamed protein product [Didymodactylos carnosus]